MSQVAGSAAVASPSKGEAFSQVAAATEKPVPESAPPSPGGSEAEMANIMKRLAHLEECNRLGNAALEKSEKDNARLERSLRDAHAAAQHAAAQYEEEWQGDAPEVDEAAAAPEEEPISGQTWAPTIPTS